MSKKKRKFKINERTAHSLNVLIFTVGLFCSVYMIFTAASFFYIGHHNSDRGWNLQLIEAKYNVTFVDVAHDVGTTDISIYEGIGAVILGNAQQQMAFFLGMLGTFLFGYSFCGLLQLTEWRKTHD